MKKVIVLLLVLGLCLSLCACGKSDDVIFTETMIDTLNPDSSYEEIHSVYLVYVAVEFDDREKVENDRVLAEYCSLTNGHFFLNEEMLEEIEGAFQGYYGYSHAVYAIGHQFSTSKYLNDWVDYQNIQLASVKREDDYTVTGKGTVEIQDAYGQWKTYKVEISYFAAYNEDDEKGYEISWDVNFYQ